MSDLDLATDPSADAEDEATADEEETFVPSTADLRFETKKFVLQSALDKASAVLPSKDLLPVLKNFQVEAQPGKLRIVATDLELSVIAETEMVSVARPGTAVFPGKRLLDLIKEAQDGDVIIDVQSGQAHISIGRTTWDLMLMDGSEYPPLPDLTDLELHSIDRAEFLGALGSVRYAAATDTVRPSLMMINIADGKMRAADGARFQQAELNFPLDLDIPIGAVDDLSKLLRTTEQKFFELAETENHLIFRVAADTFIANKLTAVFPDVEGLLLKPALGNNEQLNVDRQDLIQAIKRVRVTADQETSAVILSLESNQIAVRSQDKYKNHAEEIIDCKWANDPRDVALNHQHLLDMLNMTDAASCHFFLGPDTKTRKSPLMLKDEEAGLIGILNQIRIEFLK